MLTRQFPDLAASEVDGRTLGDVLTALDETHRGLADYLTNGTGGIRHHISFFVDGEQLPRAHALSTSLDATSHIVVVQALAGG